MLRKLSVRGKILATLAVPVLVLFIAAAMFSLAAFDDAKVAGQAQGIVDLGPTIETATQALSDERTVSVNTERGETTAKIVAARKVTDAALADLATAFEAVDTGALDARVSEALETALRDGSLGGAALDVTAVEPLPAGSSLWTTPNVIITPHAAGGRPQGAGRLVAENLAAFRSGDELRNVVSR